MQFGRQPTAQELGQIRSALGKLDSAKSYFAVEAGPNSASGIFLWGIIALAGLIILSAAGVTVGLALADGKADQATLAGVGADP
ncbi:hypothetical protein CRN61_08725, partial [Vibrio vulnificus]